MAGIEAAGKNNQRLCNGAENILHGFGKTKKMQFKNALKRDFFIKYARSRICVISDSEAAFFDFRASKRADLFL